MVVLAATLRLRQGFDIEVEIDEVVQDNGAGVAGRGRPTLGLRRI